MESEPMLTPREKFPLLDKFSPEEDRTHDAASSRTALEPNTLPTKLLWPRYGVQYNQSLKALDVWPDTFVAVNNKQTPCKNKKDEAVTKSNALPKKYRRLFTSDIWRRWGKWPSGRTAIDSQNPTAKMKCFQDDLKRQNIHQHGQ